MINSHTQSYTVWTPNSLCHQKIPLSVSSHQVPLHFPTGKGHTSGSVEKCVGALPSGTVLWVSQRWGFVSSEQCPTRGKCWHSCWAPGELKGPHTGQGCRMIDFGQQSVSLPAITQLDNSWAFFPKVQEQWCPSTWAMIQVNGLPRLQRSIAYPLFPTLFGQLMFLIGGTNTIHIIYTLF